MNFEFTSFINLTKIKKNEQSKKAKFKTTKCYQRGNGVDCDVYFISSISFDGLGEKGRRRASS